MSSWSYPPRAVALGLGIVVRAPREQRARRRSLRDALYTTRELTEQEKRSKIYLDGRMKRRNPAVAKAANHQAVELLEEEPDHTSRGMPSYQAMRCTSHRWPKTSPIM